MKLGLAFRIAKRYLFSKKSTNAINIISGVSMVGMGVGSMALILVLSVFNGFEGLVLSLYNSFYPEVKILPEQGKTFTLSSDTLDQIRSMDGVAHISEILEEKALAKTSKDEQIITLKGVDSNYLYVTGLDSAVERGDFLLNQGAEQYAVIGRGVEAKLGLNVSGNYPAPMKVYMPKRGDKTYINPSRAFNRESIVPKGVFEIQQEFDSKYVIVPIAFTRELLEYEQELSAIELSIHKGKEQEQVIQHLQGYLGDEFKVQNRYQQNRFLYKVMQTEKWAVYAILTLILVIAAFNIVGSLTMLVIDKAKDIAILKVMGATKGLIRLIFLMEGMLTSLIGSGTGVLLAFLIVLVQEYFELIKIQGAGTFVIQEYPVDLQLADFGLVLITVIVISLLASWLPANRAAGQRWLIQEE